MSLLVKNNKILTVEDKAIKVVKDTSTEDGLVTRTLTKYTNNRVTSTGYRAFYGINTLKTVDLPKVTSVGEGTFMDCKNLKSVNLSSVKIIPPGTFYNCWEMENLFIPKATEIQGNNSFAYCYSVRNIIITQTDSVCILKLEVNLSDCAYIKGIKIGRFDKLSQRYIYYNENNEQGYIYVPDILVNDYKNATNWSKYASAFKPLSELPQEYKTLYNIA